MPKKKLKPTPLRELRALGYKHPRKVLAMIKHGLSESAARLTKPRQRKRTEVSLSSFGEMLHDEFMKPHGITVDQLSAAFPPHDALRSFWRDELNGEGTDQFLFVDFALALDRAFGLPDGYFLRLWAVCATRRRGLERRQWLSQVRPLGVESKRKRGRSNWHTVVRTRLQTEQQLADITHKVESLVGYPMNVFGRIRALREEKKPLRPGDAKKLVKEGQFPKPPRVLDTGGKINHGAINPPIHAKDL